MSSSVKTVYDHIAYNNRQSILLILLFPLSLAVLVSLACIGAVFVWPEEEFVLTGLNLWAEVFPSFDFQPYLQNEAALKLFSGGGYSVYIIIPLMAAALIWVMIAYFFSGNMMGFFADAKPYPNTLANRKVYQAVENMAIVAGLPMPKLYIIDDDSLNAFATGFSPKSAAIYVTKGLVEKLEPLEMEAVIAHEMSHIGNRDIRLTGLIIMGLGIFSVLLEVFRLAFRFFMRAPRVASESASVASDVLGSSSSSGKSSSSDRGDGGGSGFGFIILIIFVYGAVWIFAYAVAPLIRLAISRRREYLADSTAALLTRNPEALASALKKICADARVEMLDRYPMMGIACIETPYDKKKGSFLSSLYSTHPPIGARIQRLYEMSGRTELPVASLAPRRRLKFWRKKI